MRPKPPIHKECGPRFPLSLHTSYTMGCLAAYGHQVSYSIRTGFFPHHSGRNVRFTTRFCLESRLNMSGAISPLPPEVFLRFTRTAFQLRYVDWVTAVSFQFLSTCSTHSSSLFTTMIGYSDTLSFRLYKTFTKKRHT